MPKTANYKTIKAIREKIGKGVNNHIPLIDRKEICEIRDRGKLHHFLP